MIFWKYIKGLNQRTEGSTTYSVYSYIEFGNTPTAMPRIKLGGTDEMYDKGAILTSNLAGQSIKGDLYMTEGGYFVDSGYFGYRVDNTTLYSFVSFDGSHVKFGNNAVDNTFQREVYINKWLCVGNVQGQEDGTIYSLAANIQGKCSAGYFVTTSDIRAKTNIKNVDFDALKLVCKTPVYSFSYKDTSTPSIGIIAQDVQDIKIGDFNLVDNENATGVDFDYMHIHEGKLVYVLWKAIQQQQEEIERLKKLIK